MNREQKRKFVKDAKKKGIKKPQAEAYMEIIENGAGSNSEAKDISEGDKIMLDIPVIKARKNYERMSDKYKQFIEESKNEIYTAHVEHKNMISLAEEPRWLFWSGDLIKVLEEDNNVQ